MEKYSLFICVEMVAKMATIKDESLRRLIFVIPIIPIIIKRMGIMGIFLYLVDFTLASGDHVVITYFFANAKYLEQFRIFLKLFLKVGGIGLNRA